MGKDPVYADSQASGSCNCTPKGEKWERVAIEQEHIDGVIGDLDGILSSFGEIIESMTDILTSASPPLPGWANDLWDGIQELGQEVWENMNEFLNGDPEAIAEWIGTYIENLQEELIDDATSTLFNALKHPNVTGWHKFNGSASCAGGKFIGPDMDGPGPDLILDSNVTVNFGIFQFTRALSAKVEHTGSAVLFPEECSSSTNCSTTVVKPWKILVKMTYSIKFLEQTVTVTGSDDYSIGSVSVPVGCPKVAAGEQPIFVWLPDEDPPSLPE